MEMSGSKNIDRICLAAVLLTLLLTLLFINGEALGIAVIADGDAGDGQFTANDLDGDWDCGGAVKITLSGGGASISGGGAYVYDGDVHIAYAGKYILSGELSDGSIIIDADKNDKIWLLFDGVSLSCSDSAAVLVEQAGKVFITLADGTENSVSTGAKYGDAAVAAGIDGAIYSRDDLTFNGGGSLSVSGEYKHGIVCNDDLVITNGNITITAAQDGIHANDSARICGAELTISAGDDGITVSNDGETGYVYIASGSISIPSCYEGIEAVDITIAGGTIDIVPTDDGINANGRGANSVIRISGGEIRIINETGRDADGLDSNGDICISGGRLLISVSSSGGNYAIDYGSENGGVCEISGGTVVAAGSSTMAEGFDSSSEQCFIMRSVSTAPAGTALSLKNSAGKELVSEVIPCSFSSVVISTPELEMGEVCTLSIGGVEEEVTVDNSTASGGFAMAGFFGGGRGQADRNTFGEAPQPFDRQEGGMPGGKMPEGLGGGLSDTAPELPGAEPGGDFPELPGNSDGEAAEGFGGGRWNGMTPDGFNGGRGDRDFALNAPQPETPEANLEFAPGLIASAVVLVLGLAFALAFKRR